MANRIKRKQYGWSYTKKIPHENHPAHYRYCKKNNDDIEYITFTHSPSVELIENGKKILVNTIPLNSNISSSERKKNPKSVSYAFPYLYEGKRHALGEEASEYSLTNEDKSWVRFLFDFFGLFNRKKVDYTSNSKKSKKR